jgi:serine/threonine-protein kinase
VVLSTGPPLVPIPNLASFSNCHDAVQALAGLHLVGVCPPTAAQYSSTVASGAIIGTTPATSAPYGSTVTIITSKGHAPVAVPTVTGSASTYAAAAATLTAAGFVPAQSNVYSSTVPKGQVVGTSPAPGGLQPFGSTVTVQVSLGPQPVTVPSLTGESPSAASAALSALGLVAGGPYGPPGATTVISTSPSAGTSVPVGTTVNVYTL